MFVLAGPLELISVVSKWCQKAPALAPRHFPLLHFRLIYAEYARVTDGARTRDLRSHNPMLCLLSYGHHAQGDSPVKGLVAKLSQSPQPRNSVFLSSCLPSSIMRKSLEG